MNCEQIQGLSCNTQQVSLCEIRDRAIDSVREKARHFPSTFRASLHALNSEIVTLTSQITNVNLIEKTLKKPIPSANMKIPIRPPLSMAGQLYWQSAINHALPVVSSGRRNRVLRSGQSTKQPALNWFTLSILFDQIPAKGLVGRPLETSYQGLTAIARGGEEFRSSDFLLLRSLSWI